MASPVLRSALQPLRMAVLSAIAFWLTYWLLWSVRSEILFQDHGRLILPRLESAMMNTLITVPIFATLSLVAVRTRWAAVVLAAILAVPAGLGYAVIDSTLFDTPAAKAAACQRQHHRGSDRTARRPETLCDADDETPTQLLLERASDGYLIYLSAALLRIILDYALSVRALERGSAELRSAARLAEIRALRYQVNPHFLFNTLNSLSTLVLQKRTADADEMIDNLANFYRNALTQDPTGDVPLSEEIRLQQLYLAIESVRFPDHIRIDLDIPDALGEALVPGLILQPLVENAVKHGVAKSATPVTIQVLARAQDDKLLLRIADDAAAGRPVAPALDTPSGVGLANVVNRLTARYEGAASCLWFDLGPRGFTVDLTLPLTLRES